MAVALTWLRLEPVSGRRTALRGRGGPRASRNRGHGWPRPGAGAWMVTSGAIALALSLVSGCSGVARRKPFVSDSLHGWNVLLVTIDTLRADHVGAYGNQLGLTPTLDRLAREGLRFTHAYAHVPLTLPSHTTIMTGAYPMTNGVRDNGSFRLDGSRPTLARALKTAGYRTGAFVGAFVLDARFGLNSGFDVYDDRMIGTGGRSLEVVQRPAEQVLAPAEHWILGEPSALSPKPSVRPSALNPQPFFAWVHLYDPHEPYTPPEPFRSRYSGNPYAGEIAYADASLGAFLDRLRNAGALNHTFIVVASDHGESLGEHGERTHGLFAYDSTLRVPLILWAPPTLAPGAFDSLARLVDVTPTILDLVGVPALMAVDGRPLRTVITGEAAAAPSSSYFEALNANLTRNWAPLKGVIVDRLKLVDLPIPELYDLAADPGETTNIYAARIERARSLESVLDSFTRVQTPATPAAVDADAQARLRSLGYVVGSTARPVRSYKPADDPKAPGSHQSRSRRCDGSVDTGKGCGGHRHASAGRPRASGSHAGLRSPGVPPGGDRSAQRGGGGAG